MKTDVLGDTDYVPAAPPDTKVPGGRVSATTTSGTRGQPESRRGRGKASLGEARHPSGWAAALGIKT